MISAGILVQNTCFDVVTVNCLKIPNLAEARNQEGIIILKTGSEI